MTVSLQLYSMRNGEAFEMLLPKLPAMGISAVEAFGPVFDAPEVFKAAMDASGLTMPGCHMGIDYLQNDPEGALRTAKVLGARKVFAPYLDANERPVDAAGYADLARMVDHLGAPFRDAGMTFGWHNHDFEFTPLPDGSIPMDVMFDAASDLAWEADLAWVIVGGGDAEAYVTKYADRIASVHVKDIAPAGTNIEEDGWADLGKGTVDWTALIAQCRAECRAFPNEVEFVLEHDNPTDTLRYAETSAKAFNAIWEAGQ